MYAASLLAQGKCRICASMDTNHVFAFSIDENERYSRHVILYHTNRLKYQYYR